MIAVTTLCSIKFKLFLTEFHQLCSYFCVILPVAVTYFLLWLQIMLSLFPSAGILLTSFTKVFPVKVIHMEGIVDGCLRENTNKFGFLGKETKGDLS